MTGPLSLPGDGPLHGEEEILESFRAGGKPPHEWGLGLEYERLGLLAPSGRAIPYSGGPGVESVLRAMSARFGWEREEEAGRVIGLSRGGSRISLEPGGQIELSAAVHYHLRSLREELAAHLRETAFASAPLGVAWVPLGLQPVSRVEEIEWVPKARYAIMAPFLAARGALAHHMMKATAGCQINLDYGGEEDAAEKIRTAMGIASVVTAAFAHSPLYGAALNGFATRRAHIWLDTDPARCGLPAFAFREDLSFRRYAEYALGVPVIFIRRPDRWVALDGRPFRAFLEDGYGGLKATRADWALHLTTIFTEVRLKTYIEVRGADSVSPALALALAALWKGILYDGAARSRAWALVADIPYERRVAFHGDVCARGPQARLGGETALDLARELSRIAREGLTRLASCGAPEEAAGASSGTRAGAAFVPAGADETRLLDPLDRSLADEDGCPAGRLARSWDAEMARDPGRLIDAAARAEEEFLAGG